MFVFECFDTAEIEYGAEASRHQSKIESLPLANQSSTGSAICLVEPTVVPPLASSVLAVALTDLG